MSENNNSKEGSKKANEGVVLNVRLGTNQVDKDIKRFLNIACPDNINKSNKTKRAGILNEVIRSFILNTTYKWTDDLNIPEAEKTKGLKISFSQLHNALLYDWYIKYVKNNFNETGIIKHIIHYQLFNNLNALNININNFKPQQESAVSQQFQDIIKNDTSDVSEKQNLAQHQEKDEQINIQKEIDASIDKKALNNLSTYEDTIG